LCAITNTIQLADGQWLALKRSAWKNSGGRKGISIGLDQLFNTVNVGTQTLNSLEVDLLYTFRSLLLLSHVRMTFQDKGLNQTFQNIVGWHGSWGFG
jgi:hypothetical protein